MGSIPATVGRKDEMEMHVNKKQTEIQKAKEALATKTLQWSAAVSVFAWCYSLCHGDLKSYFIHASSSSCCQLALLVLEFCLHIIDNSSLWYAPSNLSHRYVLSSRSFDTGEFMGWLPCPTFCTFCPAQFLWILWVEYYPSLDGWHSWNFGKLIFHMGVFFFRKESTFLVKQALYDKK